MNIYKSCMLHEKIRGETSADYVKKHENLSDIAKMVFTSRSFCDIIYAELLAFAVMKPRSARWNRDCGRKRGSLIMSFDNSGKRSGKNTKTFHNKNSNPRYERSAPRKKPYNSGEAPSNAEPLNNGSVPGRNAVRELLKSGRAIEKIFIQSGEREGSITVLAAEALSRGIPLIEVERAKLDALCGYEQHQGIVAIASEKEYVSVEDVLAIAAERGEKPLIVIADGISDPHNLGAIIRCAEGAGAHGIIIPKRRAACITPAVVKASAGAVEHLAAVKCTNITETIKKLKELGLWIFAAEADGTPYDKADFTVPCAIVLGSEENGVSELVRKNCDYTVSIPMRGKVNSLNVSTAASVLLYEAIRQRNP